MEDELSAALNKMISNLEQVQSNLVREIAVRKKTEEELLVTQDQLKARLAEIEALQESLREQAIRDPLTGLFNRRYLDDTLARELARAGRAGSPISLVMIDLDHFKRINDTYGHRAGDLVLMALGNLLESNTRRSDICCRFGGEEFVIILPDAPAGVAFHRAERLREVFAAQEIAFAADRIRATFSVGVAAFPEHGQEIEQVLRKADEALYKAKSAGRNRVVAAT